jgi:hypothetical protein
MRERLFISIALATFALTAAAACSPAKPVNHGGWSDEQLDPAADPASTTEVMGLDKFAPAPAATTAPTTFGVRHDVMIAPSAPRGPTCSCLTVVVAGPRDPRLSWQNERPEMAGDAAVVAVSARDLECPALPADAPRRPSIAGVQRDGADVVITVEDLPPGRPLASGAIIARPGPGGAVYIRPNSSRNPYGRSSVANSSRCKVQ